MREMRVREWLTQGEELYETRPVGGAAWQNLNLAALRRFVDDQAPRAAELGAPLQTRAVTERLVVERAGEFVPTMAGLLGFGLDPQTFNDAWGITALRLAGTRFERDALQARQELSGTVDALIEAALSFVRKDMQLFPSFAPDQVRRTDVPEYSLGAVREVIANAVAHRDYSVGERIQIRLFDDRLEVQSPGGLLPDLTLEQILRGGIARPRNPLVMRILIWRGYVERSGFGIPYIYQQMRALGAPEPQFEAAPSHFRVTLPAVRAPKSG